MKGRPRLVTIETNTTLVNDRLSAQLHFSESKCTAEVKVGVKDDLFRCIRPGQAPSCRQYFRPQSELRYPLKYAARSVVVNISGTKDSLSHCYFSNCSTSLCAQMGNEQARKQQVVGVGQAGRRCATYCKGVPIATPRRVNTLPTQHTRLVPVFGHRIRQMLAIPSRGDILRVR
ncbi:hypothetical protein J6590_021461 [Homalodisca vitripennis]|nr:hypothetical protein J6590_021461 [Homalodisca vitripennis]